MTQTPTELIRIISDYSKPQTKINCGVDWEGIQYRILIRTENEYKIKVMWIETGISNKTALIKFIQSRSRLLVDKIRVINDDWDTRPTYTIEKYIKLSPSIKKSLLDFIEKRLK